MNNNNSPHEQSAAISPPPTEVSGQEVTGLSYKPLQNAYVLRFTPIDNDTNQLYEYDTVIEEFLINKFDTWIITEESSKLQKIHYHMYLESDDTLDELKQKVRDFIYPYYPNRTRGFGSKQYNCQISENPLNAIIYSLKQKGKYQYSGFEQEFIDKCIQQSFEVKKKEYDMELHQLSDDFHKFKIKCPYDFAAQITQLNAIHDKNVNYSTIQSYVNSKIIKRDPKMAQSMANKNLSF